MSIKLITYKNLEKHSDKIVHFTSTRMGGTSKDLYDSLNLGLFTDDNPECISKNRALLCSELGINNNCLISVHQIHGTDTMLIDKDFLKLPIEERKDKLEGYDALITNIPKICIVVTTADCVPIILFDSKNKAVAAIHSGWRSTLNNILKETIQKMEEAYGTKPEDLIASVGPCISKKVYEVGYDVFTEFTSRNAETESFFTAKENGKFLFDIREVVRLQLLKIGVKNIEVSPYCTYTNDDLFFSARRQGLKSGRMLSGIMIL